MSDDVLILALRVAGLGQIVLALAHAPLWRAFDWSREMARVSPLTARVFGVQTFFVASLLLALGLLSAARPELLLGAGDLPRLTLIAITAFWALRLVAQILIFDPVLWRQAPSGALWRGLVFAGLTALTALYAAALARHLGFALPALPAGPAGLARFGVGLVWLTFGLYHKLLRQVPRHEHIVARVLGARAAPVLTRAIGAGEVGVGVWMCSGVALPACALAQTGLVAVMNALELRYARDLLLAPRAMVASNAALLAAAWYSALAG